MWAPSWGWVLFANALLGISQGLTWSTTVIMKIDLAGPSKRGLAMGLNEFAGYFAVAGSALATGSSPPTTASGPSRSTSGWSSWWWGSCSPRSLVRETKHHVAAESKLTESFQPSAFHAGARSFWRTTLLDKNLSSVSQAGLVNNLNDGMAWGLFPLFFAAARMDLGQIGTLAAIYPATWGVGAAVHRRAGPIGWVASG
jgi:MFS family permease